MKKVLLLLLVPLILLPLLKANTPPILHATIDGEEKPLILSKLKVEVKISGLIAETKKTMTFYNPYNRELEGELTFPLPEGAFVSGYALDINGQMVDGVVVEKERGWVVYDDIVQQGIDPGLVEWVKGNHFKTYVYPILAKNTRTIMIRYLSQVTRKKNKTYLHIPMNYNLKVEEFSLKVRIQTPATPGYIKKKDTANVQNAPWQRSLITQTTKKDFLLDKDINIPVPVKDVRNVTVEQNHDGHYYFSIHPIPPVKAAPKITGGTDTEVNKKAPKHITILWDASGSMGKTDHQKELKLLKEYFSRYKKQKIRVELKVIRLRGTLTKRFKIKHGNTKKLFKAIKKIHYDGATSLNTIVPAQEESTADFYLLFTDGNHNFGKWKTVGSFKSPLYVITAMGGIKNNYLRSLAYTSGGNLLDIAAKKPRPISSLIGVSPYIFLSATAVKGTVTGLYPTIAQPLKHPFTVTGKLLKDNAVVTLNYGINGKILQQIPYGITRKNATESTILRTFWAQEKIRHLMSTPGNKNDMVATGKKYGLVTPGTSLIVLESLRQYLRYRIKPPESLPEMRKKYEEEITGDAEYEKEKLEDIVTLWQERVDWWEKDFKVPQSSKKRKKNAILRETYRERQTENETTQDTSGSREQSERFEYSVSFPIEKNIDAGKGRNSVYGLVALPDGAVIPGVRVTLSNDKINLETITTEQGVYGIKGLPNGTYQIKAELEGFGSETVAGIHLQGGKKIKMVPIFMEPG
ncbi:MAG: hypothetical protein GY757_18140, partial [bacterium]|nr:hypothetical protein [bacterium]